MGFVVEHVHTAVFKMDNQQGPALPGWEESVRGMDTCMCTAESFSVHLKLPNIVC